MYIYSVSENGQELFRGTAPEIYRKYSILISNLSWHIKKGTLVDGRYKIAKVGMYEPQPKQKPKKKTKHDEMIEYYTYHLDTYKTTVARLEDEKRIDSVIDELEKMGYRLMTKQYHYYGGQHITLEKSSYNKRKIDTHTVIKVIE